MSAPNGPLMAGWIEASGLGEGVRAGMSTRQGGVSQPPFSSLNLRPPGLPGGPRDDPAFVHENHRRVAAALGAWPVWLDQVHGSECVQLNEPAQPDGEEGTPLRVADASFTTQAGVACAVLVADCLPVLFSAGRGRPVAVAAAHAGWRGLAAGVLDHTIASLCRSAECDPSEVRAWLGACIGPDAFEVGADVLQAFGVDPLVAQGGRNPPPPAAACFRYAPRTDGSPRWRADLAGLARLRLRTLGLSVDRIGGVEACTVKEPSRFFSYRRDGLTGRMAACVRLLDGDGSRG